MKKQYEWTERKFSFIMSMIGTIIGVLGFIVGIVICIVSLFTSIDAVFSLISMMLGCLFALPFLLVGKCTSTNYKYTKQFIKDIEEQLNKAKTKEETKEIYDYFVYQSTNETSSYFRLEPAERLRFLKNRIESQLEVFNKLENK